MYYVCSVILIFILMKYYKRLYDGRNQLISRSTFYRLSKSSGFVNYLLTSEGELVGKVFIPDLFCL